MKLLVRVLVACLAFFLLVAALVLVSFIWSGIPTRGERIQPGVNPRTALFVVDVQEDFTGPGASGSSPYKNSEPVIDSINRAIREAEGKGCLVIYIRQEWSGWGSLLSRLLMGGTALKNSPGSRTDARILKVSDNDFTKMKGDAFSNPALDRFLRTNGIDRIVLTGLDAEYCVHATARGALNRGYKVTILTDALLLGRKGKWESLLDEYRKEGITLGTTDKP